MNLTPFDHPNSYRHLWNDPAIEQRIAEGIETHRKSDATVRVVDAEGRPRPGARVHVQQQDSSFHFGANIFKLRDYDSDQLNAAYEEAYTGLFNAATVPFYWKDLEPEPGRLRFAADSPRIARRPPPDLVIDFCRQHGLRMHGHTLVWSLNQHMVPDWVSDDLPEAARLWEKRIREIAERYGDVIKRWDVVNEACSGMQPPQVRVMPEDYVYQAFESARRYFPADVRFDINETSGYWYPHKRFYPNQIKELIDRDAALGGIGLQFHLFTDQEMARAMLGELHPPRYLFESLDLYGAFGRPLHISEITLTSPENSKAGLAAQADLARNCYRLWFSHPAVEGISWWNVPDGGATPTENTVFSGLLFDDMSPKPAYETLRQLIHEDWRTEATGETDADGCFRFRGFHGHYDVSASGATSHALTLEPGAAATWEVTT
ncbi:MAG: endo-1,4-beta-xylanase [Verrucomicrobiota bacterium]